MGKLDWEAANRREKVRLTPDPKQEKRLRDREQLQAMAVRWHQRQAHAILVRAGMGERELTGAEIDQLIRLAKRFRELPQREPGRRRTPQERTFENNLRIMADRLGVSRGRLRDALD